MSDSNSKQSMPMKKKILWIIFIVLPSVLGLAVSIYMLSDPRTLDLIKWTGSTVMIIVVVFLVIFLVPIFTAIDILVAKKTAHKRSIKLPSKAWWGIALVGLILPSGVLAGIFIPYYSDSGDKAPQLMLISQTGVNGISDYAVTSWTTKSSNIELSMGTSVNSMTTVISDEYGGSSKSHAFLLTDLERDTQYFYKLSNDDTIYNFTTMPATDDTLHIALTSDCHFGAGTNDVSVTKKILNYVSDDANDFDSLFVLGDLTEFGFIDSYWKECIDTFSPYVTHVPYRPILGNHDGFFRGQNKYAQYMYPDAIPSSTGSQLFYKIEINNIHIFVMDLEWGTESYTEMQKNWFESEISQVPEDDWTIVMNHAMYYTSGIYVSGMSWWDLDDMINEFGETFVENDVDMVFSGHNHHLEMLNVSGVSYNIVGGFGGHLDPERDQAGTGSVWYQQGEYGFCDLDIDGDAATISYRDEDGTLLQSFTHLK